MHPAPCGDGMAVRSSLPVMKKVLFVIAAILTGVALYIWQDPQLSKKVLHQAKDMVTPETTTVYKWKDKDGNPVISNTPPADDTPYETLEYHRDANVLPNEQDNKKRK